MFDAAKASIISPEHGAQESLLDIMQTREELYEVLDYYNFEKKLDDKLSKE